MSEYDDEDLFKHLDKEMRTDRAKAILSDLRSTYQKFMVEIGPTHASMKVGAVLDEQPDLGPVTAEMMAQIYTVADGILLAVAMHLARTE